MISIKHCVQEVLDVNKFLEQWFGGHLENSDEVFSYLSGIFADKCEYVDPEGKVHSRTQLIDFVRSVHGFADADIKHVLKDFRSKVIADNLVLMTVEEHQEGTEPTHRLCSIVFRSNIEKPNGVEWLHLHESWIAPTEQ